MVSDPNDPRFSRKRIFVLILVLMEYGLWLERGQRGIRDVDGLNPCSNGIWSLTSLALGLDSTGVVLILVLMEYGLWPGAKSFGAWFQCLNPCSNGIWSLTLMQLLWLQGLGLNPCSNGIWSLTHDYLRRQVRGQVLILVLMEYGLWHAALWLFPTPQRRLNPCSNGIWSLTR